MSDFLEGFRTLVAGISGMGKSYFVKKVLIPILVKFKPVIIFDRKEEYAGRFAKDHDKSWNGYSGIVDFFRTIQQQKRITKQVHVINCQEDSDYISGLQFFLHLKAPVTLVLDEAHDLFLDKNFYDAKASLVKMVRYGRSYGVDIVLISQRTKDIPPDIRSQFLGAISFKQTHQDDVKALSERGWNEAEKILDLKPRSYQLFGELPKHINLK